MKLYEQPLTLWGVLPTKLENNNKLKDFKKYCDNQSEITKKDKKVYEFQNVSFSEEECDSDYRPELDDEVEDEDRCSEEEEREELFDIWEEVSAVDNLIEFKENMNGKTCNLEYDKDHDENLWKSEDDKKKWLEKYEHANSTWKNIFGCNIDTEADPYQYSKLKELKKSSYIRYWKQIFCLALVLLAYSFQFKMIFSQVKSTDSTKPIQGYIVYTKNHHEVNNLTSLIEKKMEISTKKIPYANQCIEAVKEYVIARNQKNGSRIKNPKETCNKAVLFQGNQFHQVVALIGRAILNSLDLDFSASIIDYQNALHSLKDKKQSSMNTLIRQLLYRSKWLDMYRKRDLSSLRRDCLIARDDNNGDGKQAEAIQWLNVLDDKEYIYPILYRFKYNTLKVLIHLSSFGNTLDSIIFQD